MGAVTWVCNPSTEEADTGGSLGSQAGLDRRAPGQ